ncbi:Imm1 family immunity protein [Gandjariella thermophila]|uniref:Immunity protein Imm1 n=1 Tax=Gandjariella thermophila TaxID=1931992 RepID=A0A4D4JE03_9PSEU|nr:Imm1 family immunity protein [Gandjariella thermophila]GDY33642.1 hypothetical protein GTS_52750 [Gandjariella thermophila]
MSFTIDVYYYGHEGDPAVPAVARSFEDLDRIVGQIAAVEQANPPVLVAQERPKYGPRRKPDHQIKIDLNGWAQVGAISYVGPAPDAPEGAIGSWVTRADREIEAAPTLYLDKATRTEFPRNAVLPLDLVRQALQEFRETGERPSCVGWQEFEVW